MSNLRDTTKADTASARTPETERDGERRRNSRGDDRAPRDLRLLMVEDTDDDAIILLHELRRAGYRPIHRQVTNESEFRDALATGDWDIVLADYRLPGFSGVEALRIVRAEGRDLPFLVVSGSIGEELAVEAMRAGAQDYVMKGNLARLMPAIDRELAEAAMRRERSRTTAALAASEERFTGVLDAAPTAMIVIDRAGSIVLVNDHALGDFGYSRDELVGRPVEMLLPEAQRRIHPRHREGYYADPRAREMGVGLDLNGCRRDGSLFPVEVGLSSYVSEGELFVIAAVHDISSRRELEAQLRQSLKMEAIGRLAGGVAHDFNNLLTAMNGYADLVLTELPADDPVRSDVEEIRRAGERAAALTSQLLAFGRRRVGTPQVLGMDEVVAEFEQMLRRLVGEDIEFVVRLEGLGARVKADPSQLQQVLLNLVVNARDAMPEGGQLTIATAPLDVDLASAAEHPGVPEGRWAQLIVQDTGTGMDSKTQARVFEPFFTTKPAGQGTGLGLATVYGIVGAVGGQISFVSQPGVGTTFRVYLPRTGEAPTTRTETHVSADGGTERILLVEDEPAVRALVSQVLSGRGYQLLVAEDVHDALRIAAEQPFDMIVTDVVMPGLRGPDLVRQVLAIRPDVRVLFMSGYADEDLPEAGLLEAGAAFLQKPFSADELARRIRTILDADRSRRAVRGSGGRSAIQR
jgi:two-component system cell cycle sensor histidine kinase/response regulator CckA